MLTEYKSGLPDYLLNFIDAIIKIDRSQILRFQFLHYTIDQLLRQEVPLQQSLFIFYDPSGVDHVIIQDISSKSRTFPYYPASHYKTEIWTSLSQQIEVKRTYVPHSFLEQHLPQSTIKKYSTLALVSLDQIRIKCIANIYTQPEQVLEDLFSVMAWNQLYRTHSANSFIYLSSLLQFAVCQLNKRRFHYKFYSIKAKDFEKLLTFEIKYKINTQNWPFIPDQFRQYQEIDQYVPTPVKRQKNIHRRIVTKKQPVTCPINCVCYTELKDGQQFCSYTLKDGWVSECPNRVSKIQCNHQDPQIMAKCRNAGIQKNNSKKCRKNSPSQNGQGEQDEYEIQQCIIWGIDLYTRNIIFCSLPEVDIMKNCTFVHNKENKNNFIQSILLKAINFGGINGWDLKDACQRIIQWNQKPNKNNDILQKNVEIPLDDVENNRQDESNINIGYNTNSLSSSTISLSAFKKVKEQMSKKYAWNIETIIKFTQKYNPDSNKSQKVLFSQLDKFYAEVLLANYEFCTANISNQAYRIHTKGKGARCINKEGIKHGEFLVQYYGQLYQPWRWYEREDFIKQVMRKKKFKNYIPEFYNIYLQHHKDDPEGYEIMVVDPNKKGNFSSRFSHSCNPNCGTVTTISNGKYYIAMYSFQDIKYGEELTFDYCCMTESSYEHLHSICLCGTQKCRGNYLELANNRTFSQLVDKNTCFLSRNSLILQALQPVTEDDIKLCAEYNIKDRMLADSPEWIKKWTAKLLKFIVAEVTIYKNDLIQKWTRQFPWQLPSSEQERASLMELYSETYKNDLFVLRFQNLFTTIDKMKYFLNTIESKQPPLYFLQPSEVFEFMVQHKESILRQVEDTMVKLERVNEAYLVKFFMGLMQIDNNKHSRNREASKEEKLFTPEEIKLKLFYFRLCCLCVGHMCLFTEPTKHYNSHLFGDIVYFYAFTHTYFTANEYKSHTSDEIKLTLMEITGKPSDARSSEKLKTRYSSQFVWGQLVSWYKQTIVSPQASLSQDRRGTLSFPMLNSTINSMYPFEKHCRTGFIKALQDKSAAPWPCAPQSGCSLSFKNPFKCYGTLFFQNMHSAQKFIEFPGQSLLQNVLGSMNSSFAEKLKIFKKVQQQLSGIGQMHEAYNVLSHIETKYINFSQIPQCSLVKEPLNPNPLGKRIWTKALLKSDS